MSENEKIIRVTKWNWNGFKWFLGYGMKEEFPPDEQLSMDQMLQRVANPVEHDGNAQHIVKVIRDAKPEDKADNCGFIIYHIYQAKSGPFALIEYTAGVGQQNKRQRFGTKLVDDVKKTLLSGGVEQIVIETELVPRIIENPVHTDLDSFGEAYTKTGNLWSISKGVARWDGVDQRNHFWEGVGFGIIPDLPYCQPDLSGGRKERRVPLDLQVANIKLGSHPQISVDRAKDILMALAEHNYKLGLSSGPFVQTETTTAYSGRDLTGGSVTQLEVVPYSKLLQTPEVVHAMRMHSLQSRYK